MKELLTDTFLVILGWVIADVWIRVRPSKPAEPTQPDKSGGE